MSNWAHVGNVLVPASRGSIGKPRVAVVEDVEVQVGVRADLGEVVVQVDGNTKGILPSLQPDQAAALATLLTRASGAASELAAAYKAYQDALQTAEDRLAEAMGQQVIG
ncbi:hypothetical protein I5G87_gp57 [Mycobacterium phage Ekdilam]|uniref:Uncharacterized protein n=1 Tax=Mycobacterium phage Ekdilam TaxID=2599862 RepID=A0A5J6TKX8_9CAUD|nr:hypothetical protein I5G87_gp57 [Mycobacterium phage Ekdilam]QFG11481.1 hypothetical protein PBI_EKDILAM_57 [Mycobacterium phage Ekdilam]